MTEPLRGVLIGCGFFAQNQMNAWAGIDRVEITAVCDADAGRAERMAEQFGIARHYTAAETMLRVEAPDFADIATSPASHRSLVELAAPLAGAIICQKPMAESLADGQAMVDAAQGQGIPLLIHENFRWQRGPRELAAQLASGVIGTPRFGRISFRHGYNPYRTQPYLTQMERFVLMDMGLHLFDLSRLFMGEAQTIACRTQSLNPIVVGEDSFTALVGHVNGATSVVDCSYYSTIRPEPFPQTLLWIEGDLGTLQLDDEYTLTTHTRGGASRVNVEPVVPSWGAKPWHPIQESVVAFQEHAVKVLLGETDAATPGADNLRTLQMALASYESAAEDRVIDLTTWQEP